MYVSRLRTGCVSRIRLHRFCGKLQAATCRNHWDHITTFKQRQSFLVSQFTPYALQTAVGADNCPQSQTCVMGVQLVPELSPSSVLRMYTLSAV